MINFKKISAIAGSSLMIGMTMGVAAAANYPAPFVVGGAADVAIVYGTGSGVSILDAVEAGSVQANLQSFMTGTTSTTGSVSGEAVALFTGGTKLYLNDPLNNVKTVVTKTELPTSLADQTFSGNVDTKVTQTVKVGSVPRLVYKGQPTSNDDPQFGLNLSYGSSSGTPGMFNLTATFDKTVNMTHADSEGQSISMFGQKFTVSADTSTTDLVLLKSAEKADLSSDAPSASVTIAGATYTVELVSASDSAATIKVTNSAGTSESKEINEADSKKVNGITVAVITADETNLKLSASIVAGADKVTFVDNSSVTTGDNNVVVDGTFITFGGTTGAMTSLTVSVRAPDSDKDVILPGDSFVDPVFGAIKLDFAGMNIQGEDSTARETIEIENAGSDKMQAVFTDWRGKAITQIFAINSTNTTQGFAGIVDTDGRNLTVREGKPLHANDYVVVGNEDDGYLLKLASTANSSTAGTDNDKARFTDASTGDTLDTTWTAEGTGTLTVGGLSYTVTMRGDANNASEQRRVYLNYPDSTDTGGNNTVILFPTIQTSKGAKVSFYHPVTINVTNIFDGEIGTASGDIINGQDNLSAVLIPDGDGYTTVTINRPADAPINTTVLISTEGNGVVLNTTNSAIQVTVGGLNYVFVGNRTGINKDDTTTSDLLTVYLRQPGGTNITQPALIVWEEKDDNSGYNAMVVTLENSSTGIGISSSTTGIADSWANASAVNLKSNNKIYKKSDLWGSIMTVDTSASDQYTATISYPDEQVYAQIYVGANDATITAGGVSGGATQLGDVLVKDSEVSSVSSKNLVVVGGSCINSVAANLVDAGCGSAWTDKTGVGSGQFLIQSFGDAYTTGKVALLVAGYDVSDTVNAAKYLRTQAVKTDASTKYIGTSSTSAELQTTESTA